MAACTNDSDEPLEFAQDSIWSGTDFGAQDLSGATLRGNIALVPSTQFQGGTLAAVDLTTGRTLWSADDGDPILGGDSAIVDMRSPHDPAPPVIRDLGGGEFEVLVSYRTEVVLPVGDEKQSVGFGVAALSGTDGNAKWVSEPLVESEKEASGLLTRPVVADEDTVVAATSRRETTSELKTWALDATTGKTLWSQDEAWPTALGGGNVMVESVVDVGLFLTENGPERDRDTVAALDAQSGKPTWDLDDEFVNSTVEASSGRYAIVEADDSRDQQSYAAGTNLLIRTDTGETVEELGESWNCHASSVMIVCSNDDALKTIRTSGSSAPVIEDSTPYGSDSSSYQWAIESVFDETVIVHDETEDVARYQALDPEGKVRAEELPGSPKALNEEFAVYCGEEKAKCGFHAADVDFRPDPAPVSGLPPLVLGEPLWSFAEGGANTLEPEIRRASGVALVDDSVVYQGDREDTSRHTVVVAEAETGKTRWSLEQMETLRTPSGSRIEPILSLGKPDVVETGSGWSLVLPASSGGEQGVVAVNGTTGDVESFHPIGEESDLVDVEATGAEHVAVSVRSGYGKDPMADDWESEVVTRTELVDLSEPKKPRTVWTVEGVEPVMIAAGRVVVREVKGSGATKKEHGVRLLGMDKNVVWNSEDERKGEVPRTARVAGALLIVGWDDGTEVFAADSGEKLGSIGKFLTECRAEDGGVDATPNEPVMCDSSPDDRNLRSGSPIVIEPKDSGVEFRQLRDRVSPGVAGAHKSRFFLDSVKSLDSVDQYGATVDTDLPGYFSGANSEGLALFTTCHPSQCLWDAGWEVRTIE